MFLYGLGDDGDSKAAKEMEVERKEKCEKRGQTLSLFLYCGNTILYTSLIVNWNHDLDF